VTEAATPACPTLILLPGLDGTGKLLRAFCSELGEAFTSRIIGYPVDQPMGYDELTHLVTSRLPADPFVLLGESFSGPIALRIAAEAPAHLKGLILCGTFGRNPFPMLGWAKPLAAWVPIKSLPRWVRSLLMWGSRSPRRAPKQAERAIAGVAASVVRRRVAALLGVDETANLTKIAVPTLVISGRRDRIIPKRATRWLLSRLPHAQHVEIDGPHLLLQSCPHELGVHIGAFVRGLPT
jgi:pimeloyl-ACP methyl ester carboxylesterase